jgi:hypothetical protein
VFGALALIAVSVVGLTVYAHLKSFESTDDAFISVHYQQHFATTGFFIVLRRYVQDSRHSLSGLHSSGTPI